VAADWSQYEGWEREVLGLDTAKAAPKKKEKKSNAKANAPREPQQVSSSHVELAYTTMAYNSELADMDSWYAPGVPGYVGEQSQPKPSYSSHYAPPLPPSNRVQPADPDVIEIRDEVPSNVLAEWEYHRKIEEEREARRREDVRTSNRVFINGKLFAGG